MKATIIYFNTQRQIKEADVQIDPKTYEILSGMPQNLYTIAALGRIRPNWMPRWVINLYNRWVKAK